LFKLNFDNKSKNNYKVGANLISMGYIVIAPVGDNLDALFVGMKEFPTEKVILITPHENIKNAQKLEKKLDVFSIPAAIKVIHGSLLENMFATFGQICSIYDHDNLIVNVATGDRMSTCAALSASFANGLKTFGVVNKKPMLLPIMKLSYYNELSDSKMKMIQQLKFDEYTKLSDLAERTKLSTSLISYHLNGTLKYKGLIGLRLAEVKGENKRLLIKLSELGRLLLKGYVNCNGKN
jgi:hypothetical protein